MTDTNTTAIESERSSTTEDRPPSTTEESPPIATLDGIGRTYGGVPVVESVSLSIPPGVTGVIGPNGSGKSTLLGLLAGVVEPVEGTVEHPIDATTRDGRRVGYLPQEVPFRGSFTARETLEFYARFVDADPDALLDSVGLSDAGDRRVDALSGGMRRLLGIAQATIGDPPLVVLDEPTSGLDPGMRERAFRLAAAAAATDTAVVVSSHDLDLVGAYADRLVLLDRGSVAATGSLAALFERHEVSTVEALYRAVVSGSPEDGGGPSDRDPDVHVTGVSE